MKTGGVAWRARPYSFLCFCELDREKGRRREPRVGKWETWFWFSTSPSGAKPGGGNVGISRCWRDFQGPVGSVGNLLLVFHSPHGPAIPTARLRPRWGSGKPEPGFPLPHAGLATTTFFSIQLTKTQKGVRPGTPGHTSGFHAHSALEPSCSFMLILRLENALFTTGLTARGSR